MAMVRVKPHRHAAVFARSFSASVQDGSSFFNRKGELRRLEEETRGGQLLLLTGPPDSGKSRLLKQYVNLQQRGVISGYSALIDMHSGNSFNTAAGFCRAIKAAWAPTMSSLAESASKVDVLSAIAASYAKMQQADDFPGLLDALESLLFCYKSKAKKLFSGESGGFPTLILDEANSLHEWSLDPQEQRNLLQLEKFFIRMTKQERLANVVLSTSEDFFRVWMNTHIGADRYSIGVIGDFLADESLNYFLHDFEQICQREGQKTMQPPSDELWEEIFQFTGGRALILSNLARKIYLSCESIASTWPSLKKTLLSRALSEVKEGLYPEGFSPKWACPPPVWSADMWRTTMGLISQAENGVLAKDDLLSSGISCKALYSMVQHNFLHYRAEASLWAKDLDWYEGSWPIVMPRSRPHYHAICQVAAQGGKN